jgi:hypothetical protein
MGSPAKGVGGPLNDTSIVTEVAEAKEHDDNDTKPGEDGKSGT